MDSLFEAWQCFERLHSERWHSQHFKLIKLVSVGSHQTEHLKLEQTKLGMRTIPLLRHQCKNHRYRPLIVIGHSITMQSIILHRSGSNLEAE